MIFSYNSIKQVTQGNNRIYAAAENAVFSVDLVSNEIKEMVKERKILLTLILKKINKQTFFNKRNNKINNIRR